MANGSGSAFNAFVTVISERCSFALETVPQDVELRGSTAVVPIAAAARLASDPRVAHVVGSGPLSGGAKCPKGCKPVRCCGCICPGQICWF